MSWCELCGIDANQGAPFNSRDGRSWPITSDSALLPRPRLVISMLRAPRALVSFCSVRFKPSRRLPGCSTSDHLIEGLKGVCEKLDDEGDRIQHDIGEYGTFSQSIIELTKIVSEGMTFIKAPLSASQAKDIASPSVSPAD